MGGTTQASLSEIDTQRKEELENLLETLTLELRERLEELQRVNGKNSGLKRERDELFASLRGIEALCQQHGHLEAATEVLDVLCDNSTVRHLL